MEDFGTDSRMQTRECSGLHDRGKGAKTPGKPCETACKNQNKKFQTHS